MAFPLDVIAKYDKTLHKLLLLDCETYGLHHTPDKILPVPSLQNLHLKCSFLEDVMFAYDPHSKNLSGTRRSPRPCALTFEIRTDSLVIAYRLACSPGDLSPSPRSDIIGTRETRHLQGEARHFLRRRRKILSSELPATILQPGLLPCHTRPTLSSNMAVKTEAD